MVGTRLVRTTVAAMAVLVTIGVAGPALPAGAAPVKAKAIIVSATPSTAVWSQVVRLTASITPRGGGAPGGGTVTFLDGDAPIATATATTRNTSVTTTSLAPGEHQVRVAYSGDAATSPGTSAPITVSVAPAPTTVTATTAGSVDPGAQAEIRAVVRPAAPATTTRRPTGTVTFTRGSSTVKVRLSSNGVGTWRPRLATTGWSTVTATYDGDGTFAPGGPASVQQAVRGTVRDQSATDGFVSGGSIENGGTFWMDRAQLFTAGVTGDLARVGLVASWGEHGGTPPGDLIVTIQPAPDGVPTGAVLGTGTLSTSDASEDIDQPVDIALSTPAPVVAGTRYALVLQTVVQEHGGSYWNFDMLEGGHPDLALSRSTYFDWIEEYYDLAFTTWVTIT